jgi:hypothetical protein
MIDGLRPEVVLGRICSNWKMIETVPHEAHGLDFRLDSDPAAIEGIEVIAGGASRRRDVRFGSNPVML